MISPVNLLTPSIQIDVNRRTGAPNYIKHEVYRLYRNSVRIKLWLVKIYISYDTMYINDMTK